MQVNDIMRSSAEDKLIRVLHIQSESVLVIDCSGRSMPVLTSSADLQDYKNAEPDALFDRFGYTPIPLERLSPTQRKTALERYTMIANVLAVLHSKQERDSMIGAVSDRYQISRQTVRAYLKRYLIYQDVSALAPAERTMHSELTTDQKKIRWALNKFYYTQRQNSLMTAYTMMLKAKYTDNNGILLPHPSFYQFRYFYRKTYKAEKHLISRCGIKDYQRNNRPLLGDGVQSFAPSIGTAFLDGTICDIYLVNDAGQLVGRPILVAAIDVNTSLCMGYALLWEGGVYSLKQLMLNLIADKVQLCERMGIQITHEQWPVKDRLPGVMVTDRGCEYVGETFEQITELGVTLVNLPAYRPELKGPVEKFFDLVQTSFKDALKGKGVIMPDFRERGAHDYRKDAVLTMELFERVVVKCIIYYNCSRIIENYPYSQAMINAAVPPYANRIWDYKSRESGAALIPVSQEELILRLFPRTTGSFTRYGLKVNRLRYYADGFKERFLRGGEATVAYDPEDCGQVWLKAPDGSFVPFQLIESRFRGMDFSQADELLRQQKDLLRSAAEENYAARVELLSFIEGIAGNRLGGDTKVKSLRGPDATNRRQNHKKRRV